MEMSDHTYPCCACCDENPHLFGADTHISACQLCQTNPKGLAARAWDEGADFVTRNPGMGAEYVRDANPYTGPPSKTLTKENYHA